MLEVFLLAVAMIELDLLIVIVSLLDGFERKVVRYLIVFVCNVTLGRDRKTRNVGIEFLCLLVFPVLLRCCDCHSPETSEKQGDKDEGL